MDLVRAATAAGVTTITLDSPANRNALSTPLMTQLLDALTAAQADPAVRVVVLSHTGPVFCSGADLKETAEARAAGRVPAELLADVLAALWEYPKPVVARVAGPARAGGIGLIGAADLAVCTREATFAFTEVRLGVIPAVISATVLPRLSARAAAELYLTGDTFDGIRAAQVGLVTAAVPAAELDETVNRYAQSLVRGAPTALAAAKELLRHPPTGPIRTQLAELTGLEPNPTPAAAPATTANIASNKPAPSTANTNPVAAATNAQPALSTSTGAKAANAANSVQSAVNTAVSSVTTRVRSAISSVTAPVRAGVTSLTTPVRTALTGGSKPVTAAVSKPTTPAAVTSTPTVKPAAGHGKKH